MKRFFAGAFLFLSLFLITPSPAWALTIPSFPSCESPQGTLKVFYTSGTHGIVGSTASYIGSDKVYILNDLTLTQCFCPDNGNGSQGIQTNWWKVSSLSESEINSLKNQGWIYIPDGSLWGLDKAPYLAQNTNFSCKGGIGGGEVLGVQKLGKVLGLAATGDSVFVLSIFTAGFTSLLLGVILLSWRN
ncbi:hypothetical protein HY345_03650 [Candidatus Microgenomates bacterium]|nr:hypothetical protein [Candidatus Microgenomates bacterium]